MPVTIIAEAALEHQGDINKAFQMVDVAKDAGADYIKFQTFFGKWEDLKQYEFTKNEWIILFDYCKQRKQKWISTAFDFEAIDFLKECGQTIWKIPSGMVTNYVYLGKILMMEPEWIILSTGMATEDEIFQAKRILHSNKNDDPQFDTLYCISSYPTSFDEIDLNAIDGYGNYNSGISDHSIGIEIPIAAVAMGAQVIEKHFTLDRNNGGPDVQASLEPDELKEMVKCIRNVELAMGDGKKKPTDSELKVRDKIRKRMGAI